MAPKPVNSNKSAGDSANPVTANLVELDRVVAGQKKLLVIVHNNPDPDALASAFALSYIVQSRHGIVSDIAYGGLVSRPENMAMVRELKITLKKITRIRIENYDLVAMVDTQPGAGNNLLPSTVHCHIVIDHHPLRRTTHADFLLVRPELGTTATILIEWLSESGLSIPSDLATALAYAIRSETLDLGRETSKRDVKAYLTVFPKISIRKFARIAHPKLPRSYFIVLANTLQRTLCFRNLMCAHLGQVPAPEIVAEMADLLLQHKHMSWSLCSGRYKHYLLISIRSSNPRAEAGKIIQQLVPNPNNAGGHGMFAGGKIDLDGLDGEQINGLEKQISRDFARLLGYQDANWKPLLLKND